MVPFFQGKSSVFNVPSFEHKSSILSSPSFKPLPLPPPQKKKSPTSRGSWKIKLLSSVPSPRVNQTYAVPLPPRLKRAYLTPLPYRVNSHTQHLFLSEQIKHAQCPFSTGQTRHTSNVFSYYDILCNVPSLQGNASMPNVPSPQNELDI